MQVHVERAKLQLPSCRAVEHATERMLDNRGLARTTMTGDQEGTADNLLVAVPVQLGRQDVECIRLDERSGHNRADAAQGRGAQWIGNLANDHLPWIAGEPLTDTPGAVVAVAAVVRIESALLPSFLETEPASGVQRAVLA